MSFLDKYGSLILGITRIVVGLLFLEHGTAKLLHFPVVPMFAHGPLPPLMLVSGIIELVGGALVALGFFSRIAAFVCSGQMAVAYFIAHFPANFFPILNGGELAIVYAFVFLYLAAAGPGSLALNNK
ncbi:MAG: DoxX [Alphaproteobacteria bacterium]|jgi:putative oxidoreductase|nr:DoxX [Alphaproteobacteria bacterium]MDB5739595.1 DoxX [Alphaproteobacteria bacterium]